MKEVIIIALIALALFYCFGGSCDETETYYLDYNGDGECQPGEEVYYEDSDGEIYFYD